MMLRGGKNNYSREKPWDELLELQDWCHKLIFKRLNPMLGLNILKKGPITLDLAVRVQTSVAHG